MDYKERSKPDNFDILLKDPKLRIPCTTIREILEILLRKLFVKSKS
jgi:hypothetical protein